MFLPNSNPSGSHKTMCRGNSCFLIPHHLEWHLTVLPVNTKYIIFNFLMALVKMIGIGTKLNHPKNGCPMGWTVQKSNPSEDNIFHNHPNQPRGPHSLLYNRYWVSFVGVNLQGCDINHPPPTSTSYSYVAPLLLDTTSCKDGYHITKQLACSAFGADIVSNICVNAFRT